ncbi:MAG: LPS assembly lipoprotein LptE [Myxococcota bacterium]|nr:LPS assembly lipoprotein LptE [Myxococcota bacterium]
MPEHLKSIAVGPVQGDGVDVDVAALISRELRLHLAEHPSVSIGTLDNAKSRINVQLLSTQAGLTPMSDPANRAAQYRTTVVIKATVTDADGEPIWLSRKVTGQSDNLSVGDDIEALDGRRRTALERAVREATRELVTLLVLKMGRN